MEATLRHDKRADGVFLYGSAAVGEFCLPSCRKRRVRRRDIVFFNSPAEARAWGLRPCPRCRPDRQMPEGGDVEAEQMRILSALFSEFTPTGRCCIMPCVRAVSASGGLRACSANVCTPLPAATCAGASGKSQGKPACRRAQHFGCGPGVRLQQPVPFYEKFWEDTGMTPAAYRAAIVRLQPGGEASAVPSGRQGRFAPASIAFCPDRSYLALTCPHSDPLSGPAGNSCSRPRRV